jgi:pilus assembly protein TadC
MKLTIKDTFKLIFKEKIEIEKKTYRLPYYVNLIKIGINLLFILGGFLFFSIYIRRFFSNLNIDLPFFIIILFAILIMILINFLIVKISPLIEINKDK